MSHFYQLVLPPLFPFLIADFELTYTELGVLMTVFFVASGFGQPVAGFVVDRLGARRVLLWGFGLYCLSIGALAIVPSFALMFPLMVLAGLGNSVFHPADFTLLNANVRVSYLGRAFGVHTLGGNLGWALAPAFMILLAGLLGWREALVGAAVLAGTALTGFLLGAAAGVVAGGLIADRSRSHTLLIIGGLLGSGVLLLSAAHFDYASAVLIAIISAAGFLSGVTTPSRDLMVRAATPPGATGRVFGVVYSGLDVGSAFAPITVGWMLDQGHPQWALWAVALLIIAAVFTVVGIRSASVRHTPAAT